MKGNSKLPSFTGVAANQTATLRIPIGWTYEQLWLQYSGVTLAQMTGIRLVANGITVLDYRGATVLDTINQFHGRAAANGFLAIDLNRFGLRTRQAEELTGIGTGLPPRNPGDTVIQTLALEVDIASAASNPALNCWAKREGPSHLDVIKHVRPFTYSPAGVGEYEVSDLPKGHLFNTVHLMSGDVNALKIESDNRIVFERPDGLNRVIQADGVRVPQSNVFTFDPTEEGNGGEMLRTAGVQDLRFRLEMGAAATVPIYVESIAPLV